MVGVHDKHSLCAPPIAGINEGTLLAGILHQTLDRGGIRLTMPMMRSALTILPKPMFSSFMVSPPLLNVLICSRIFSISDFSSTTSRVMATS